MKTAWRIGLILGLSVVSPRSYADVWDVGTPDDDGATTQNELVHGANQVHDLAAVAGVPDVDQYRIGQPAYSSWEVIVDGTSANQAFGVTLQRTNSGGSVLQTAVGTSSLNHTRSLRWQNTTAAAVSNEYVRAQATGCSTNCTASDVYRVRTFDTTLAVPRFNNNNQVTVLFIQNTAGYTVNGTIYFWSNAGALLATAPLAVTAGTNIPAKQLMVLSLVGIPAIATASGSVTITHDGRYGDLVGKAVTLEASTGYSFDTPVVGRP